MDSAAGSSPGWAGAGAAGAIDGACGSMRPSRACARLTTLSSCVRSAEIVLTSRVSSSSGSSTLLAAAPAIRKRRSNSSRLMPEVEPDLEPFIGDLALIASPERRVREVSPDPGRRQRISSGALTPKIESAVPNTKAVPVTRANRASVTFRLFSLTNRK